MHASSNFANCIPFIMSKNYKNLRGNGKNLTTSKDKQSKSLTNMALTTGNMPKIIQALSPLPPNNLTLAQFARTINTLVCSRGQRTISFVEVAVWSSFISISQKRLTASRIGSTYVDKTTDAKALPLFLWR